MTALFIDDQELRRMRAYARNVAHSEDDGDDVMQDALVAYLEGDVEAFDPVGYLNRMTRNAFRQSLNAKDQRKMAEERWAKDRETDVLPVILVSRSRPVLSCWRAGGGAPKPPEKCKARGHSLDEATLRFDRAGYYRCKACEREGEQRRKQALAS